MEKHFIKGLIEKAANGGYSVLASTADVDRQGDVISQAGWETGNFMKNPVMLWAHDYTLPPVAKVLSLDITDKGLVATYEFAPAEANPFAQQVKALVDGGFLNAVSVGFIPKEQTGNYISKQELLEISFVPVPANQEALQLMASKGITEEVIAKFFKVKEEEVLEEKPVAEEDKKEEGEESDEEKEKGLVADELAEDEKMEDKYDKWNEVMEVICAFADVYFAPETDVEAFQTLLNETIGLLAELVASDGADDDEAKALAKAMLVKAINPERAKALSQKIGARVSKDTKKTLDEVLTHLESASALIGALTDAGTSESDTEEGDKSGEGEEKSGAEELRSLFVTRNILRENETESRGALGIVNRLIKEKQVSVSA